MFKNVLVGVNEGQGGRDAIAFARVLLAQGGELTLAHVFDEDPVGSRVWSDPAMSARREHASSLLELAATEQGVDAHLRWRGDTSMGRGLHEVAEAIEADLLVVGSSQRGLLGRAGLRDDTRAALNGAPCAVAVAPAGYGGEPAAPMREIGVGYDGSPESEHALAVARALAAEFDCRLSAFEAVSVPRFSTPRSLYGAPETASAVDRAVAKARARIATAGGVEPHAAYGDPVEELALYSASLDLLVVGSRGYGPIGRLVHGSTAQHLTHTARCPLLILTRTAGPASTSPGFEARGEAVSTVG